MVKQSNTDKWFKDKNGNTVLFEAPNWLLIGWVAFRVISYVHFPLTVKNGFAFLSTALLIVWACQEIITGTNYFRRALGAIVLLMIIVPKFY